MGIWKYLMMPDLPSEALAKEGFLIMSLEFNLISIGFLFFNDKMVRREEYNLAASNRYLALTTDQPSNARPNQTGRPAQPVQKCRFRP